MAKETGTFVDDARLRPRDNSGPGCDQSGEFGGGRTVGGGGKPAFTGTADNDMKTPTRRGGGY